MKIALALIFVLAAAPAAATGCGAPDYGSDVASSAAFITNFRPMFEGADETVESFLERVCNAKFGGRAGGRAGLLALGLSDLAIDSEDVPDLAVDALRRARDIIKSDRAE